MNFTLTETQTTAFDYAVNGNKRVIVFGGAIPVLNVTTYAVHHYRGKARERCTL